MGKDGFVSSIKDSELKEGHMKPVRVKGRPILLVRQGGAVFGVSNRCPHEGCSFERGTLKDYFVMCPCHGWKFDVRNGQYPEIKGVTYVTDAKSKTEKYLLKSRTMNSYQ